MNTASNAAQGGPRERAPSPFIPGPNEPCFCGKKKAFGVCCGSKKRDRKPPSGVIVKRAMVKAAFCDNLVAYASQQHGKMLGVTAKDQNHVAEVKSIDRQSMAVDLNEKGQAIYSLVEKIFKNVVSSQLKMDVKHFVYPTLMRYESGGYYHAHTDSEIYNWELGRWEKRADRDVSLLIYLNNDFEGGDLHFNYFHYSLSPRKGDVVLFPSDHRYMHEAEMVSSGTRYVIVSWGSTREASGQLTIDGMR